LKPRRYLTTPIYYPSGEPHIGHAYTTILGDVLARYYRQTGCDVLYMTGTDEHGDKMVNTAKELGVTPLELADQMSAKFKAAWERFEISNDRFIRTTEPEHIGIVRAILQRWWDKGLIYAADYSGWYCVHEERYWTEKELGDGNTCPDCQRPVQHLEEKNYFFKMSEFQDRLIAHIEENPDWIVPESRKNEVLGFLQQPLRDLSISRPITRLNWGVRLPFDEDHVCYVWADALINYVTGSGVLTAEGGPDQKGFHDTAGSWWPCDLHLVGKDIITTHAVYWPTFLMGADLPLPRQILAHGWWVAGDAKMSKSLGNVIDPLELREEFGTDAVRWYLLRDMPTGADASYTPERFLARYDALANVLGNLASRSIAMVAKYRDGVVPDAPDGGLSDEINTAISAIEQAMGTFRVHDALGAAMDLAREANGYIGNREPWVQAKDPDSAADLDETLATLMRTLAVLTALFQPVMPQKMADLAERLSLDEVPTIEESTRVPMAGREVSKGDPLFPRKDLL
jgi:methionyl-tRNA synthetase